MHARLPPARLTLRPCRPRRSVGLPDGRARGYVLEVFGAHFELPSLGPIGGWRSAGQPA